MKELEKAIEQLEKENTKIEVIFNKDKKYFLSLYKSEYIFSLFFKQHKKSRTK